MQISIRHKFAFLCNPKCGSTSVEKAIRRYCEIKFSGHPSIKHITASGFHLRFRPLLEIADPDHKIETFCIMREPIDRMKSWYKYRSRHQISSPAHRSHKHYSGNMSFTEFIQSYLDGNRSESKGIGTQSGFMRLADGSVGVDRIFRLDQMDAVADFLSRKLGQTIEIPRINQSSATESSREKAAFDLPADLKKRLVERLATDYALYESIP